MNGLKRISFPNAKRTARLGQLALGTLLAWIAVVWGAQSARAEIVYTDTVPISGYGLYNDGAYWWHAPGNCSNEFPADGTVRVAPTANKYFKKLVEDCHALQNDNATAVRDDSYVYYFQDGQLWRKAINDIFNNPATAVPNAQLLPNGQNSASLLLAEGVLYWGRYNSQNGQSTIVRLPTDGSASEATVTSAAGPIKRLEFISYSIDANNTTNRELVWLTSTNFLFRYRFGQAGAPTQLASGVADFALHQSFALFSTTAYVFVVEGSETPGSQNAPAGKVRRISLNSGQSTVLYTAPAQHQVLGIAIDGDYSELAENTRHLFIIEAGYTCGELFCNPISRRINRHAYPAPNYTTWETVDNVGVGYMLRANEKWVYQIPAAGNGNNRFIERFDPGVPPVQLDVKALALEPVQIVQQLEAPFSTLVVGKPTFVRGYAHLAQNSTGQSKWHVNAELHGFFNNQELPGSPLTPLNDLWLDTTSDLSQLRADLNDGYLFRLPDSWVAKAGELKLTMVLDPEKLLPETASLANNTLGLPNAVQLFAVDKPCLNFVRIDTSPLIDSTYPGLPNIVYRARTLMPVNDFHVYTQSAVISKPVFDVEVECWGPFCVPVLYIHMRPFTFSADQNSAQVFNVLYDMTHSDPGNCGWESSHQVGAVSNQISDGWNGLGITRPIAQNVQPAPDLMIRMNPNNGSSTAFSTIRGGFTLAHELGHNYGRLHVNQSTSPLACGTQTPAGPYDGYPFDPCMLGDPTNPRTSFGFDPISQTVITPTMAGDLMSYASNRWVSLQYWSELLRWLPHPDAVSASAAMSPVGAEPQLLVSGLITPTAGTASFNIMYQFPVALSDTPPALNAAGSLGADLFTLRQVDSSGATLAETTVITMPTSDGEEILPFAQYLSFNSATKRIQLRHNGTVLAEKVVSDQAPVITLQAPVVDETAHTLALAWSAFDPDNLDQSEAFTDYTVFLVQYSPDNGASWQTVLLNYPWLSATVPTNNLPGGTQALVRVLASDGINTTIATSAPFVLAKHTPVLAIAGVEEGQRVPYTETITLDSLALDAEDGSLDSAQFTWTLTGPRTLNGNGNNALLSDLTPGSYTATFSAIDSDSQSGTAARHFEVLPLVVTDQATPVLDGNCNETAYSQGTPIRIALSSGQPAHASLLHADGALYVCVDGLHLAASNAPTMTVALHLDLNASGEATVQAGDIGFQVDEYGVPTQLVVNGAALQPTLAPQLGAAVFVVRGANSWSAEWQLDESLLGGWNHLARLYVAHAPVTGNVGAKWPVGSDGVQPATWGLVSFGPLPTQPNRAPVANAGTDQIHHTAIADSFSLDGSMSSDADGDALSYSWTQVAGPAVTLAAATTAHPSFTATVPTAATTLRFQLVVNDGQSNSVADEVVVTLLPTAIPNGPTTFVPNGAAAQTVFLPLVQR